MKRIFFLSILILSIILTACGAGEASQTATETPAATSTPDPCSAANLPAEVTKVNKLMREFDDYSTLASNTPQAQLIALIPEMQRILRDAEDQNVPSCLATLKQLQLAHMDIVVQTLMAFMNSTDVNVINAGIGEARDLHNQYNAELARLLGATIVVQPAPTTASGTPEAGAATVPAQPAALVTNPGPSTANLRSAPALNAAEAGLLAAGASSTALGKSADEQWIQVEIPGQPGQTAWVFASLVQLSVPITQLPVVE